MKVSSSLCPPPHPTPPPRPVSVRHFVCGRVTPSCFGSNYLGHISYLHSPLPFVSRAGIQQDLYQSDGGLRFVVVLRFKAAFAAALCRIVAVNKGKFLYSAVSSPQDWSRHFTLCSLADLFNWTPTQLLWEAFSQAAVNVQRLFVHKYPPLPHTHWWWTGAM